MNQPGKITKTLCLSTLKLKQEENLNSLTRKFIQGNSSTKLLIQNIIQKT